MKPKSPARYLLDSINRHSTLLREWETRPKNMNPTAEKDLWLLVEFAADQVRSARELLNS